MDMQNKTILPVFPLDLVVFPSEPVALHIFEERYETMIGECRRRVEQGDTGEFVIVHSDGPSNAEVGTSVQVHKVLKTYEDGRLDLVALGVRRCRLDEWIPGCTYRQASVSLFQDEESDWDERLANRVYADYGQLIQRVTGDTPSDAFYSGKPGLSFLMAPTSGLALDDKQALLEMRSENHRLAFLEQHLARLLEKVPDVLQAVRSVHTSWQIKALIDDQKDGV
jgi:Lon protease-like protein